MFRGGGGRGVDGDTGDLEDPGVALEGGGRGVADHGDTDQEIVELGADGPAESSAGMVVPVPAGDRLLRFPQGDGAQPGDRAQPFPQNTARPPGSAATCTQGRAVASLPGSQVTNPRARRDRRTDPMAWRVQCRRSARVWAVGAQPWVRWWAHSCSSTFHWRSVAA